MLHCPKPIDLPMGYLYLLLTVTQTSSHTCFCYTVIKLKMLFLPVRGFNLSPNLNPLISTVYSAVVIGIIKSMHIY